MFLCWLLMSTPVAVRPLSRSPLQYALLQGFDTAGDVTMPSISDISYTTEEIIFGLFSGGVSG